MSNTNNMEIDESNTTSNIDASEMARLASLAMQSFESEPEAESHQWDANDQINLFATDDNSANIFGSSQANNMEVETQSSIARTNKTGGMTMLEQAVMAQIGMFGTSGPSAGTTTRGGSLDLEDILRSVEEAYPGKVQTEFTIPITALSEERKKEYVRDPDSWAVKYVYSENTNDDGETLYGTKFMDGRREELDLDAVREYDEGSRAMNAYLQEGPPSRDSSEDRSSRKRRKLSEHNAITIDSDDEDESAVDEYGRRGRRTKKTYGGRSARSHRSTIHVQLSGSEFDSDESDEDKRRSGRKKDRTNYADPQYAELDEYDEDDEDDERESAAPKAPRPRKKAEKFKKFEGDEEFAKFHIQTCGSCDYHGDDKGQLVYCQGCSMAYHQNCIGRGPRSKHLVTRIGEDEWVLQCKRCINEHLAKDPHGAKFDRCITCGETGPACHPFRDREKKPTPPTTESATDSPAPEDVKPELINNVDNVLFRCVECHRGFHFHHLPYSKLDDEDDDTDENGNKLTEKQIALDRMEIYSGRDEQSWSCADCLNKISKVESIVAWRPKDPNIDKTAEYEIGDFSEDDKEYLLKYEKYSYLQVQWVPGSWCYGHLAKTMLVSFARKHPEPKYTNEEAVPTSFVTVEIVMDVAFDEAQPYPQDVHKDVQLERIGTISRAYVKFWGLDYDQVAWEEPPARDSGPLWDSFERAYANYVEGFFTHVPTHLKAKAAEARELDFGQDLELKEQPAYIPGGEMMGYQKEGMNWLYYKWYSQENCILADEMGLGKTLQAISLMAILKEEHGIWPFLVVAPHSTIPNWKREIQKWAPSLRVVSYYGGKDARKTQRDYEMFHKPTSAMRLNCHVVITSYTTPVDDINILRRIPWQLLIVDEGQRLKNDKGQAFQALKQYKIAHKVLLTGTPLQNNARELFNLLHFLDPKDVNPEALDEKYAELNEENVKELHNLIRPYFLRRTKAATLGFLPPMAEIIVPVSMSSLQKKLYKTILAKDANLIKSIFSRKDSKVKEKAKLNNILMQLRKCLCHPFLYRPEIEEDGDQETVHRSLIDAASKLQLLELMLPKLHTRGHRVLFFTQFLGMLDILEDFLKGMGLECLRLDGSTSSLERQKRIDAFNADDSPYFAFLLSTRAGGVGINLASADTVIIMDPDFNPHQDLQALSRAHRIGQKNKMLVFFLMNRGTVEERIMELGKKKLSLDHVIIEQMDEKEDATVDVENILKFGARALFEDDDGENNGNIKYDSDSIDGLLDRSTMEKEHATEKTAENAFSFARIWENKSKGFTDEFSKEADTDQVSADMWDKIIKEREEEMRREEVRQQALKGNSRLRARQKTQYIQIDDEEIFGSSDVEYQAPQEDAEYQAPQHPDSDDEHQEENEQEVMMLDEDLAVREISQPKGIAVAKRSPSTGTTTTPLPHIPVPTPEDIAQFQHLQNLQRAQMAQQQQQLQAPGFSQAPSAPMNTQLHIPQPNRERLDSLHHRPTFPSTRPPYFIPTYQGRPIIRNSDAPIDSIPPGVVMQPYYPQAANMPGAAHMVSTVPLYNNLGELVGTTAHGGMINCNACRIAHAPGMCIFDLQRYTNPPQIINPQQIHNSMNLAPPAPIPNGIYTNPTPQQYGNTIQNAVQPNTAFNAPIAKTAPSVDPNTPPPKVKCIVCKNIHRRGQCPMRQREPERCPLCGGMHFMSASACPHLKSVTYVTHMIEAVKKSNEDPKDKDAAMAYLRGRKGTLVRNKKSKVGVETGNSTPGTGTSGSSTPNLGPVGLEGLAGGNRRKTIAAVGVGAPTNTAAVLGRGLGAASAKGRKSLGRPPMPSPPIDPNTAGMQLQLAHQQQAEDQRRLQQLRQQVQEQQLLLERHEQHQRLLAQAQLQTQQLQQDAQLRIQHDQLQQQAAQAARSQGTGATGDDSIMIDDSD